MSPQRIIADVLIPGRGEPIENATMVLEPHVWQRGALVKG